MQQVHDELYAKVLEGFTMIGRKETDGILLILKIKKHAKPTYQNV